MVTVLLYCPSCTVFLQSSKQINLPVWNRDDFVLNANASLPPLTLNEDTEGITAEVGDGTTVLCLLAALFMANCLTVKTFLVFLWPVSMFHFGESVPPSSLVNEPELIKVPAVSGVWDGSAAPCWAEKSSAPTPERWFGSPETWQKVQLKLNEI